VNGGALGGGCAGGSWLRLRPSADLGTCSPPRRSHTADQRQCWGLAGLRAAAPPVQVRLPPVLALTDLPSKHLEAPTVCPVEAGRSPGDGRWESISPLA